MRTTDQVSSLATPLLAALCARDLASVQRSLEACSAMAAEGTGEIARNDSATFGQAREPLAERRELLAALAASVAARLRGGQVGITPAELSLLAHLAG